MMNRLKNALANVDPLVMIGAGIMLLSVGLNGFAETLRQLQSDAEETMATLTQAASMNKPQVIAEAVTSDQADS